MSLRIRAVNHCRQNKKAKLRSFHGSQYHVIYAAQIAGCHRLGGAFTSFPLDSLIDIWQLGSRDLSWSHDFAAGPAGPAFRGCRARNNFPKIFGRMT
jgi:hypothetical protein